MNNKKRKILVTSALPYANGPIHLGHMVEYLQTDIWVRFQKLNGHDCKYVCASDAHGTPIMLKARELGITPEVLTQKISADFICDFSDFGVNFDNYHTTHSVENEELVKEIYKKLTKANEIYTQKIEQSFDEKEGMFLPDRFVRGTCPRCKSDDQPGDACEICGTTNTPETLINPISVLSKTKPIKRKSDHYFFKLSKHSKRIQKWMGNAALDKNIISKLNEWFDAGLNDWDISRDEPYFGFKIPDTEKKYFYVWLDAPIGYMASFKNLCNKSQDLDFNEYWNEKSTTELYHFIGKDIMYFHMLFWPAVLKGAGFRTPTSIFAHGFLTVNGKKMSKSRGTFIKARTYLDNLNPEYLRYYYAAKLGPTIEDIDLNLDDFIARVNSDLVGKFINIASRCAGFINKEFHDQLSQSLPDLNLFSEFSEASDEISQYYESREYSKAIRKIMLLADLANRYIDKNKPWIIIKDEERKNEVQQICTQGLNMFRSLMIYLSPVNPMIAEKTRNFFNEDVWQWSDASTPLLNVKLTKFNPLLMRIDSKQVQCLLEEPET
ncbi:MAG: methionine--tRNA ligase [Gammaproteobacteria bacterium]|nr:methionine--tRNA ligase [Gammaproteobacteria bacterium]|tara:strand:- start:3995 stop:5644 length:1650 start_codon:yes stop_codon:yes gene_type:complete